MRSFFVFRLCLLLGLGTTAAFGRAEDYKPLEKTVSTQVRRTDTEFTDAARNRVIPIRIYQCEGVKSAPVIMFSHGLGGSRSGSVFLGEHWAQRGYVAVFVQHPGSDEGVWRNQRLGQRMEAMREAANGANLLLRVQDISAVIDQLEKWAADSQHQLHGVVDLKKIGMSGHSFGAQTTQVVSGQTMLRAGLGTDPRIRAALPMSPNTPAVGDPVRAFSQVKIPWLLMTGTQDVSAIGGATVETRRAVYTALPAGSKYELVLDKAEHSVFTDRALPSDKTGRNPNHHRAILALSTAFWDAYLKEDPVAKSWLDGSGPGRCWSRRTCGRGSRAFCSTVCGWMDADFRQSPRNRPREPAHSLGSAGQMTRNRVGVILAIDRPVNPSLLFYGWGDMPRPRGS